MDFDEEWANKPPKEQDPDGTGGGAAGAADSTPAEETDAVATARAS